MSTNQPFTRLPFQKSANPSKKIAIPLILILLVTLSFASSASSNFVSGAITYSVTISTVLDSNTVNGVSVPITKDGIQTGYYTPHTFTGLSGTHNFTIPYADSSNHPFHRWSSNTPTDSAFNTITVSSGNTFWAYYDSQLPREGVSPAQQRYYVTPSDPSVLAIASNKSWSDIINWVSSSIDYDVNCNIWQFPNETIALRTGQCREFSTLAVSMLLARGYPAYVTTGNLTDSRGTGGHAWIVVKLNNVWYHFEPQSSWADQPSPKEFLGYSPEYFVNDKELLASTVSYDPPPAQTYDVTINTVLDGAFNGNQVAIYKDGLPTGFVSPHTFVGLSGTHNFTIPYFDENNHWVQSWSANTPDNIFTTITVSLGGTFTAYYTAQFNISRMYPAEYTFLVTPHDTAVVAAAGTKSLSDIVDYVSALPVGSSTVPQFPNQTLAKGTIHFFLDRASLCCSMLCARGYTAYLVRGDSPTADSWVVISINGIAYHLDPRYPWNSQQSRDFSSYSARYYVDENGIYPPNNSVNPPSNLPSVTPTPTPSPPPTPSPTSTPTPTAAPTPTSTAIPQPTATETPIAPTTAPTTSPTTSPTITPTTPPTTKPTPAPTATSTPQPTPTPTIPELAPIAVVTLLLAITIIATVIRQRELS